MNSRLPEAVKQEATKDDRIGKPLVSAGLRRMGEKLDTCFTVLGFKSTAGFGTRKYKGEMNGRAISVTIAVRTRTQYITSGISYRKYAGLWMDISVTTTIKSRLSFTRPSRWLRRLNRAIQKLYHNMPVTGLDSVYDRFLVWAHDPEWARQHLGQMSIHNALGPLILSPDLPANISLHLNPERWQYSGPVLPAAITPEAVRGWINRLTYLAELTEQNPPPNAVEPNWLERQNPTVAAFVIAAALLFGIPLLMFACCLVPALMFIILSNL